MCRAIVEYLAHLQSECLDHEWQQWLIRPVTSGNNRVYRVTRDSDDWAVKFAIRDNRDRARREFNSLVFLDGLQAQIAPRPIHLDLDSYEQAVVVQTWMPGTPLWSPPQDDATWLEILHTYRRLHLLQPAGGTRWDSSDGPVLSPLTPDDTRASIHEFSQKIPPAGQSERLTGLIQMLDRFTLPTTPESLCWAHGDPNIRNLILTADGIKLVDWEYSGISDPTVEIAKLMSHSNAAMAGEERWAWVAEQYAALSSGRDMLARIQVMYALRLVGWCVRLLFGRHVLLRQPSVRLVGHGPEAEMSTLENIDLYFERAHDQLVRLG